MRITCAAAAYRWTARLASCHPGMRGSFLLIESERQLRLQAGEARVPDCNLALACGSGG